MRETRVGKVENLIVTKENSATDWVIARLSNDDANVVSPVLSDIARISQLPEITQFIFGQPLRINA